MSGYSQDSHGTGHRGTPAPGSIAHTDRSPVIEDEVRRLLGDGDVHAAVTAVIRGLGPEVLGFLHVLTGNPNDAGDVFSDLCVRIWKSLQGFRGDSSLRTWTYVLARRAFYDHRDQRAAWRERHTPLTGDQELDATIARVRTHSTSQLREQRASRVQRLRARLTADDQALLTLRIDRNLEWRDIAQVLADAPISDAEQFTRAAAALRKRFERVKAALRRMASEDSDE